LGMGITGTNKEDLSERYKNLGEGKAVPKRESP